MRRNRRRLVAAAAVLATVSAGCGSGFGDETVQESGPVTLQVLVGSGTTAESRVLREQTNAWSQQTGNTVEIVQAAEIDQQLGQAFAGGNPPDLFYLAPGSLERFIENGSLHPYGDQLRNAGSSSPRTASVSARLRTFPRWRC